MAAQPGYILHGESTSNPNQDIKDGWNGAYENPLVAAAYDNGTMVYSYEDAEGRVWEKVYYPDGTYDLMTPVFL